MRTAAVAVAALCLAVAAIAGPLLLPVTPDLPLHVAGHLLVGMVAPLLLVTAAPVTLALRVLSETPGGESGPEQEPDHAKHQQPADPGRNARRHLVGLRALDRGDELRRALEAAP